MASTDDVTVNKIFFLQKRSVRIVFNEDVKLKKNFALSLKRPLLRELSTLNIFQICIYQYLTFVHKFINSQVRNISCHVIKKLQYKYINK